MVAYPGRLSPLSNGASMTVTEKVAGSAAVLVYDGTSAPEVRPIRHDNYILSMLIYTLSATVIISNLINCHNSNSDTT